MASIDLHQRLLITDPFPSQTYRRQQQHPEQPSLMPEYLEFSYESYSLIGSGIINTKIGDNRLFCRIEASKDSTTSSDRFQFWVLKETIFHLKTWSSSHDSKEKLNQSLIYQIISNQSLNSSREWPFKS